MLFLLFLLSSVSFASLLTSFITHSAQGWIFGVNVGTAAFIFMKALSVVTLLGTIDTLAFMSAIFYSVSFALTKEKSELLFASTALF